MLDVYFMMVVFNAKFALLIAAHENKTTMIAEEARLQNHVNDFPRWPRFASRNHRFSNNNYNIYGRNTLTFNFYRSLGWARKNESIIYFSTIYAS